MEALEKTISNSSASPFPAQTAESFPILQGYNRLLRFGYYSTLAVRQQETSALQEYAILSLSSRSKATTFPF
jgi:hypothetical protein